MGWIGIKRFASDTTCFRPLYCKIAFKTVFSSSNLLNIFFWHPLPYAAKLLWIFPLISVESFFCVTQHIISQKRHWKRMSRSKNLILFKQVPSVNPNIELWIRKCTSEISGFMNLCKTLWWCWVPKYTRKLIWDYIELGSQQKTRSRKMWNLANTLIEQLCGNTVEKSVYVEKLWLNTLHWYM